MHVAQINFLPLPPDWASAEMFERWPSVADIAESVASSGIRVSVVQMAARAERISREGVEYLFVDAAQAMADDGRPLAALLEGLGADVLHVHGLGFAEAAHAVARHLPGRPMLLQDHASRPPRWWRRAPWRRWYAAAAGVAFTAPVLARPFVQARLFGPATRVFAIPESSSRFTRGSRAGAWAETGLYGDPCVAWVGHLNAGKDPLTVLEGIARVADRLPGLHLWCAFGSAPLLAQVRRRIERDPRLAGRVHLLGKLAHAKVESLLRAADLFVSGSRSESCGYALLEAMACGVAPVVTDIPAHRALVGDVGRLWPCGDAQGLADALLGIATHRPSAERVRAHFDANLSFAAVGRQWAAAYAQLLDGHR